MRLANRLKQVMGYSDKLNLISVNRRFMKNIFVISMSSVSLSAWTRSNAAGCGTDALSALPDQPVALQRVERSDEGKVRVAWALRSAADESDDYAVPRQLQTGAEFDVLRCLPPGRWVALGHGEVIARNGALVEGLLHAAGQAVGVDAGVQDELVSGGNLYPMPMVGDLVVVRKKEIAQVRKVTPRVTIPADSLFDPSAAGLQLELSRSGQESLKKLLAGNFADAHGKLLIEVHARRAGSRQKLRQETALRAESIERFLRYEFGIAKEQLLAVGHGSDIYVTGSVPAGSQPDYVVLRMLTTDSTTR